MAGWCRLTVDVRFGAVTSSHGMVHIIFKGNETQLSATYYYSSPQRVPAPAQVGSLSRPTAFNRQAKSTAQHTAKMPLEMAALQPPADGGCWPCYAPFMTAETRPGCHDGYAGRIQSAKLCYVVVWIALLLRLNPSPHAASSPCTTLRPKAESE